MDCIYCKSENTKYDIEKKSLYCYDCFRYFSEVKLTDFVDGDKVKC